MDATTKKKPARLSTELQAAARIDRIMSELDIPTTRLVVAWFLTKFLDTTVELRQKSKVTQEYMESYPSKENREIP